MMVKFNITILLVLIMTHFSDAQKIFVGPGPEDMVLDTYSKTSRLLISCSQRQKGKQNFEQGNIISLDLTTLKHSTMLRTGLYNNETINPHGIDLALVNNKLLLYVISHLKGNSKISYIYIFEVSEKTLNCINRICSEEYLWNPNDLTVSSDGHMFITNIYRSQFPGIFFDWLFKRKNCQVTCITPQEEMFFLINKLAGPNGILLKDKKLYVSITRTGDIYEYTLSENYKQIKMQRIIVSTRLYPDNLSNLNDSTFLIACHNSILQLIRHFLNPNKKSGFSVLSISIDKNGLINTQTVIQNDGTLISGVSTAILHKSTLILSQFMGDFIIICSYDESLK